MLNLIVFFSRKGQNYINGTIQNVTKGHVKTVAEFIQNTVGGDMFEIKTVKPYPRDYHKCTNVAQKELLNNSRPTLLPCPENLDKYDNIFVGFPNWWGTMPMAVFSFLEKYDFTGKTVIPFCTNAGSGFGNSEHDLKRICVGANVKQGLAIPGAECESYEPRIADWAIRSI